MTHAFRALLITLVSSFAFADIAAADDYADTVQLFKNAGQSGTFFDKAYGYAVFPTVGKGALGIGGARGKGRVYAQGKYVGDATLTQVSIGFQAGGQAYSQIVFFEDERAYREFTSGEFGFGAGVSAVAITAAASATASTTGNSAGISGGKKDATTTGEYFKGMAVFTIAKGGLMYEAALAGQKFSFRAKKTE
ncbi:MAG: YSC84-related protein [Gammaproteobacteria bacterium]|jgi:lipid-binding SYLF domain-containing protein